MILDPALNEAGNAERVSLGSSAPYLATSEVEALANKPRSALPSRTQRTLPPNERTNGPFGRPAFAFIVLALPALWVGWLVYRYGVDMPWGDAWDSTRLLLEKMEAGTLGVGDFFAFHNEHRIFFPRLLTLGLAKLTHWNVRAELLMIWILLCLCSLNLWRVAQVSGWLNSRARYWLLLGTNILLFTPLQWENLLWGFQIGFILPLATMTACLWVAPSLRRPFDFLATMVLCLISTFSIASGFASWFLTAPLLLLWNGKTPARGERIWRLIWASVGIVSIFFYFHGIVQPAAHPSPMEAIRHPLQAVCFALAYLGNPFGSAGTPFEQTSIAQIAGAALVIVLLVSVLYLWRCRRDRTLLAHSLPWLSLTSIALTNAVLTTFGRLGFGISGATPSRYVSFAIMLPIGLLFLVSLILRHWHERFPVHVHRLRVTVGFVSFATALTLLFIGTTIRSVPWRALQHEHLTGKSVLLFIDVLDEPEALVRYVHWSHWTLKAWTDNLDRLGYFHPRLVRSNQVREIAADSDGETVGEINQFGRTPNGELRISGWAILPGKHRIADSVLLAYDTPEGEPIIFARVDVKYPRSDVSERLDDEAYHGCGWMKSWKPEAIPSSAQRISAWAFDAEEGRAFQIGAASMERPKAAP